MQLSLFPLFALCTALSLGACSDSYRRVDMKKQPPGPQYWQRIDAGSARFVQGPKAQQLLDQSLEACAVELSELEKLYAIPDGDKHRTTKVDYRDTHHRAVPPGASEGATGELPFDDFLSCMEYRGWEPVETVPYALTEEDVEEYVDGILARRYQTRIHRNDLK